MIKQNDQRRYWTLAICLLYHYQSESQNLSSLHWDKQISRLIWPGAKGKGNILRHFKQTRSAEGSHCRVTESAAKLPKRDTSSAGAPRGIKLDGNTLS